MKELIERIEGAEGPSRELDAEIALTQGWSELPGDNWCGPEGQIAVPRYTASLDAAMSLVPEGMQWRVDSHHNIAGVFEYPTDPETGPYCVEHEGEGLTPALALCAAALRAIGDTHDD